MGFRCLPYPLALPGSMRFEAVACRKISRKHSAMRSEHTPTAAAMLQMKVRSTQIGPETQGTFFCMDWFGTAGRQERWVHRPCRTGMTGHGTKNEPAVSRVPGAMKRI